MTHTSNSHEQNKNQDPKIITQSPENGSAACVHLRELSLFMTRGGGVRVKLEVGGRKSCDLLLWGGQLFFSILFWRGDFFFTHYFANFFFCKSDITQNSCGRTTAT